MYLYISILFQSNFPASLSNETPKLRNTALIAHDACQKFPVSKTPQTPTIAEITEEQRRFINENQLDFGRDSHKLFVEEFGDIPLSIYKKWRIAMKRY